MYIRQILINEPNEDLRYIYFNVKMVDNITPALGLQGQQPEINISDTGWDSINISVLQELGLGNYRALLNNEAVNQLGIIISRFIGTNTFQSDGETIEIVSSYRNFDIYEDAPIVSFASYCSLAEAEIYFSQRLDSDAWIDSSPENKLKALIAATSDIENLAFSGCKTFLNQLLEFPRDSSLIIPRNIKIAQCEQAFRYLDGYDSQLEIDNLAVSFEVFLTTRTMFDGKVVSHATRAGINNEKSWRLLKPYLRDPWKLKLVRTS